MSDLSKLTDEELFYSVGSQRPSGSSLAAAFGTKNLPTLSKEYDDAVAEMRRRDAERGFPYRIPMDQT